MRLLASPGAAGETARQSIKGIGPRADVIHLGSANSKMATHADVDTAAERHGECCCIGETCRNTSDNRNANTRAGTHGCEKARSVCALRQAQVASQRWTVILSFV